MLGLSGTTTFAAGRLCALALAALAVTAGVGRSGSPETAAAMAVPAAAVGGARACSTAAWPYVPAPCAGGDAAARRVRLVPVDVGRAAPR